MNYTTDNNMKQRIAILGLGGVGGYYGGMLAALAEQADSDFEVLFIARGKHLEEIKSNGLKISTPTRQFRVRPAIVSDDPSKVGAVDYLIVASKSYDLAAAIDEAKPMISDRTVLLPLLNGANISEQLRFLLPNNEVWHGCVYISARKADAGHIVLEADRELFYFGAGQAEGPSMREQQILRWLIDAGIRAYNPQDIELYIQKKFVMISSVATATSYFDAPIGEVLRQHQEDMDALLDELECLYAHLTHAKVIGIELPADTMDSVRAKQLKMPQESTSSMHADFMAGKNTELENLTGWVLAKAKQLGLTLPTYQRMYEALKLKSKS